MFFGDKLKESREKQELTIEEIAKETKIQKRYLIDIEEGKLENLPGKTYVRGFLKSYSRVLKEDSEEILRSYEEYCSLKGQKEQIVENIKEEKGVKKEGKGVKKEKKVDLRIKNAILAFLILVIFYFATILIKPLMQNETGNPIKTTEKENKTKENQIKNKKQEKIKTEKKKIEIIATGKSWLEIKEDAEIIFLGYIEMGEIKKIETDKKIFLKIGDASKIKIKYNEKELGKLGEKNQVIKKEF